MNELDSSCERGGAMKSGYMTSFYQQVLEYRADRPNSRLGQVLYSVVEKLDMPFALSISGTNADPYYDDGNIELFFEKLYKHVSTEEAVK